MLSRWVCGGERGLMIKSDKVEKKFCKKDDEGHGRMLMENQKKKRNKRGVESGKKGWKLLPDDGIEYIEKFRQNEKTQVLSFFYDSQRMDFRSYD